VNLQCRQDSKGRAASCQAAIAPTGGDSHLQYQSFVLETEAHSLEYMLLETSSRACPSLWMLVKMPGTVLGLSSMRLVSVKPDQNLRELSHPKFKRLIIRRKIAGGRWFLCAEHLRGVPKLHDSDFDELLCQYA
jgi:hypothetical protein